MIELKHPRMHKAKPLEERRPLSAAWPQARPAFLRRVFLRTPVQWSAPARAADRGLQPRGPCGTVWPGVGGKDFLGELAAVGVSRVVMPMMGDGDPAERLSKVAEEVIG